MSILKLTRIKIKFMSKENIFENWKQNDELQSKSMF